MEHDGGRAGVSRREFLAGSALAAASWALGGCGSTTGSGGKTYTLKAQLGEVTVGGMTATLRTFNGQIPGPLLEAHPGDVMRINFTNALPAEPAAGGGGGMAGMRAAFPWGRAADDHGMNTPHDFNHINLHTHGFQVSPSGNEDNVLVEFEPGQSAALQYTIPRDHPPGFYQLHPHKHGALQIQLCSGMSCPILIYGEIDHVKEIAAAKEQLLDFQEIRLGADHMVADFNSSFGGKNPITLRTVNGQLNPTITMRPGEVQRWRLLNGGARDFLYLQLTGHELWLIAVDGINLPKPERIDDVLLTPGNRVEVLVKAKTAGTYPLQTKAYNQGFGGVAAGTTLLTLQVAGAALNMALPTNLPTVPRQASLASSAVTKHRSVEFTYTGGPGVNGKLFDPTRIDYDVPLEGVEEWTVLNNTTDDHPFHIHTNPFQVVEVNGAAVPPRWMDTVNVTRGGGRVVFRTRFRQFTGTFPLHCHIAAHEDMGMMALVRVS